MGSVVRAVVDWILSIEAETVGIIVLVLCVLWIVFEIVTAPPEPPENSNPA